MDNLSEQTLKKLIVSPKVKASDEFFKKIRALLSFKPDTNLKALLNKIFMKILVQIIQMKSESLQAVVRCTSITNFNATHLAAIRESFHGRISSKQSFRTTNDFVVEKILFQKCL